MIAAYDASLREALGRFTARCFAPEAPVRDPAAFAWLYLENPHRGSESPVLVVPHGGEVLGMLGMIPVRLATPAGEVPAAWGVDFMVHPDFRHAGIGGFLIRAFDEKAPAALSLGVTDEAFEVFMASGRTFAGTVPVYKAVLGGEAGLRGLAARLARALASANARRSGLCAAPASIEVEPFDAFDGRFDGLWERCAPSHRFAVARTAAHLGWRFDRQPGRTYRRYLVREDGALCGYVVTWAGRDRRGARRGYVADLLGVSPLPVQAALERAVNDLREEGARVVECLATHRVYRAALRRAGFIRRPGTIRLLHRIEDPEAARGAGRLDAWHLTYADADALTLLQHREARDAAA